MALKIRLRQQGRKNRQTFRLVLTDIRNPRDGKYLETLGSYDPLKAENNFSVNFDRITHWMSKGALLTPNAESLIAKVSPDFVKDLHAKDHQKRERVAAKRRASRQKKKA